jgi:hypothetical protein
LVFLFFSLQACAENCSEFGVGVSTLTATQKSDAINLKGDYNNDGITDYVLFLRLVSNPQFHESVKVINLFGEQPEYPERGSVAIGIVLMGESDKICEKYIIYNDVFFNPGETSMWGGDVLPIYKVKKGDKAFRYWEKQVKKLKTDALQFSNEGDQKILLYWNGITFVTQIDDSPEEP